MAFDYKVLASAIAKVAPLLASSLLGPAAGLIVSLIESYFGISVDDLLTTLDSDPQAAVKLKALELKHKDTLESLAVQDRNSARNMYNQTIDKTGKADWMLHFLAFTFTVGFFAYLIVGQILEKKGLFQFDRMIFQDLLNEESIVLLFYFGGVYRARTTDR